MRRRHFLAIAAAAAASRLTRLSFADSTIGKSVFRDALEQARRAGVPLVVLVIPESDDAKYNRGRCFGDLLSLGKPEQLAPLTGASLVCAPMSEVRQLGHKISTREPWMVVIDERDCETLDGTDGTIESLAQFLATARKLVVPRQWRALVGPMRDKLATTPPPGSHWATHSVCGFEHVEGLKSDDDDKIDMDCGMGSLSGRSKRFLYLWTRTPQQRYFDRNGRKV
jgi:hypothetical protein